MIDDFGIGVAPVRGPRGLVSAVVARLAPRLVLAAVAAVLVVAAVAACGGSAPATPMARGQVDFLRICAACHGSDGAGLGRAGTDLRRNEFVRSLDDAALVDFLKVGRTPDDPQSKTRQYMPPRGGNPRLTDEDLAAIVAYLRTLS